MVKGPVQIVGFEKNGPSRIRWQMVGRDQLTVLDLYVSNFSQSEGRTRISSWIVEVPRPACIGDQVYVRPVEQQSVDDKPPVKEELSSIDSDFDAGSLCSVARWERRRILHLEVLDAKRQRRESDRDMADLDWFASSLLQVRN